MKITTELLAEKRACAEGLAWFAARFPEGCESEELLAALGAEQRGDWQVWVLETFRLSGLCESFFETGKLASRATWRAGRLDGLREIFYETGKLAWRENWRAGKLIE